MGDVHGGATKPVDENTFIEPSEYLEDKEDENKNDAAWVIVDRSIGGTNQAQLWYHEGSDDCVCGVMRDVEPVENVQVGKVALGNNDETDPRTLNWSNESLAVAEEF